MLPGDTTSDVDLTRFVRFVAGRCSEVDEGFGGLGV